MKRIAVLQSNYIPWKGYFELIASVDEFVLYDTVQYTKNDWRNRNRIKTPQGAQWLSIPVGAGIHRTIDSVAIPDPDCGRVHWRRIVANYVRAKHFDEVATWLEPIYCRSPWTMLSAINRELIGAVCLYLEIATSLTDASAYRPAGDRNDRLVSICRQADAKTYVSGPAARSYLDVTAFDRAGVDVEWFEYGATRSYRQLWGPFIPDVSILDLLFNCGPEARHHLRCAA